MNKSSGALRYFILAMVLYPEAMRNAQKELDDVVGRDRLPTFEDQAKLPYVQAVVKEVLRWGVVTPMGMCFAAIQFQTVVDVIHLF